MSESSIIRPVLPGRFPFLRDNEVHAVALGNMTQFDIVLHGGARDGALYVGLVGAGCYRFSDYVNAGYAGDKLKVLSGDAGNLADFINSQLDIPWESWEPQGRYDSHLTHPIEVGSEVMIAKPGPIHKVLGFRKPESGLGMHVVLQLDDKTDPVLEQLCDLINCT